MKRLRNGLAASLAFGLIAIGVNPIVAGDELGRTGDEVKLSPSFGADRALEPTRLFNVKLSRNGRRVVASTRRVLYLWDGDTGRRLLQVENAAPQHYLGSVDIDESGRRIVTGGVFDYGYPPTLLRSQPVLKGSLADLWDANSGRLARTLVLHEQRFPQCAAISRNGARVACAGASLDAKLWDAETGRELASVDGTLPADSRATSGAFSDDATRFVCRVTRDAGDRRVIHLCDLTARCTRTIAPIPGDRSSYGMVSISGDGSEVVAWLGDAPGREVAIFDFATGALRKRLPGPECRGVSFLAVSPDEKAIALGKEDGRLDIVDLVSGARVELRVSDGPVRAVAFLPNRVRIVAERKFVVTSPEHSAGYWAGPLRIADFAVRLPTP